MLKLIVLAVVVAAVSASLTTSCLNAICQVESRCRPLSCSFDVNGIACGYYQIHKPYFTDCRITDQSWKTCTRNKSCADRCVAKYLDRYARRCTGGRTPTCEDYARVHNGGPAGCKHANTLGYWTKVRAHLH